MIKQDKKTQINYYSATYGMGERKISVAHRLELSEPSQHVLFVHPLSDSFMPILDMNASHLQTPQTHPSFFPYPPRWIRFCKPKTSLTKGIIRQDASDKESGVDELYGNRDEAEVSVYDVISIWHVHVHADSRNLVTILLHCIQSMIPNKVGTAGT